MTAEPSGEWGAMESALEAYFLARDRGESLDVLSACNGDAELAAKVLAVLGDAPDLVVDAVGDEAASNSHPASFGDFDIVEQIGKGGMGTVYLAMQRSLGREVALKVLDGAGLGMAASRVRMRREAELTALLDHPGIVPVYAVGDVGEVPFIAMKYLLGPSLADVQRPWDPERVATIGAQLADALDAAHVQGVVHRDVKPANIIMDGESPVFVDFGLARAQSDMTLTQEGKVAGTLRYMAPERLDASSAVLDPRVDIYGLGATLYELLAAREVFGEQSPTALVRSVLAREPAPLRLRGRHHDLETIVMRALSKDPRHRFATARDMAEDLRRYLRNEPVTSRRMSRAARSWRMVQRYPRTSSVLAVAVLLVVASLSAFLVVSSNSRDDRDRRFAVAQEQLREQNHEQARDGMLLLAKRHPGDPEVAAWLALAEAEVAIDQLLVLAADHATSITPSIIANLSAVAQSAPAGERRSVVSLAAAVALAQSGDVPGARAQLAALSTPDQQGRTAAAIRAWLDGVSLPWSLPDAESEALPDEVMLTTLVLRIAGASPQLVLRELQQVDSEQRQSPRMIFVEAVARGDEGQWEVAASLLRGLAREESWSATWRWLATMQLLMGHLDEASVSLQYCQSETAGPVKYLRLQHAYELARRAQDRPAQVKLIEDLRAKPDRTPHEEQFLAEYDGKIDAARVPDSLTRLAALHDASSNINERERLLAMRVVVAGYHLPNPGEGAAELHQRYLVEWLPHAATLQNRVSRSLANPWVARSLCSSGRPGDLGRGLEMFHATCLESPGAQNAAVEYAKAVLAIPADVAATVRLHHVLSARTAIDAVLDRIAAKRMGASKMFTNELRYYAFFLVWRAGDYVELLRRFESVKGLLPESVLVGAQQAADAGEQAREELRKR